MDHYREEDVYLREFAGESNEIEGIYSDQADDAHYKALMDFVELPYVTIDDLCEFVHAVQPNAVLRTTDDKQVMIGGHLGLKGSKVEAELEKLLEEINSGYVSFFTAHMRYETIHPFTDGNGRSGRALWLWQHIKERGYPSLSFKHAFYYQAFVYYRVTQGGH